MVVDTRNSQEPTPLDGKTFEAFQNLVYRHSGISLGPQKATLVRARIAKRMRALGLVGHRDYLRYIEDDASEEEVVHLLDAISTNVTHFFRESAHFDIFAHHLNDLKGRGQRRFRLWSAACSSGEEPYSMAMIAREHLGDGCDVKILATDISTKVLGLSATGFYPDDKMDAVPLAMRERYFHRERDAVKPGWRVAPDLRAMITIKRLNLSKPPFPMKGPLDAVFCRNVMIYFDRTVRQGLLDEITRLLVPGGLLFVGHAESLTGMLSGLRTLRPACYRKD
jgi:chemotaxis protein methyltransferase CheR